MNRKLSLDKVLSNKQKKLLREYYNSKNGVNYSNINGITRRMGLVDSESTYRDLQRKYNADIDLERKRQRRNKEQLKRQLGNLQHLGELNAVPVVKNREKKYYKENVIQFDYTQHENYHQDFYTLILGLAGQNINVVIIQDGKIVKSIQVELPNKTGFANWWKKTGQFLFFYPEDIFEKYHSFNFTI
jgi:hypothetical protein